MICNHGNNVAYCGCNFARAHPGTANTVAMVARALEGIGSGIVGAVLVHLHSRVAEIGVPRASAGHYLMWCPIGLREALTTMAMVGSDRLAGEKLANVLNVANCKGLDWESVHFFACRSLEEVKVLRHKGQWARKCETCQA